MPEKFREQQPEESKIEAEKISSMTFEWESHTPYKKEGEDSFFMDESRQVFVVTDGVTRSKNEQGEYPYPSPALKASKAAAGAIGESLTLHEKIDESDISQAFASGNTAVKKLNKKIGLWKNHNYLDRDLAGTVGSCAVEQDGEILYGYIGDCGVAHISGQGELIWHSDDDVSAARTDFPKPEEVKGNERIIAVRKDFRNNPTAKHKTYGVLTGEDTALSYVHTGRRPYNPGDVLLVYSDGISPFILEDAAFRSLLLEGDQEKIQQYVAERSSPQKNYDEKTLILLQTAQQ